MEFTEQDFIDMPDIELGEQLIGRWAVYHVLGIKNINLSTEEQRAEIIREIYNRTLIMDTCNVTNIVLEKALKKAVSGEFAAAGIILRDWFYSEARNLAALNEALTGKRRQSRAASTPRPKKKPTNSSLTMEVMKDWRVKNHTFDEFITSALNQSIPDLEFKKISVKYELSWPETKTEKKSVKTLLDWWTNCQK